MFLDEPENYVALPEIQPRPIELADCCGDSAPQAALCSRHPELIDHLGGARGLMLRREDSGATRVQSLAGKKDRRRAGAVRARRKENAARHRLRGYPARSVSASILSIMEWRKRRFRVVKAPPGRGAADAFVRRRFVAELRQYRRRRVDRAVVVMVDGGARGVARRIRELDDACRQSGVLPRSGEECVAAFVPTWSVETWLAYLDGEAVTQDRQDYPRLRRERECGRHIDRLAEMRCAGLPRRPAPPSLLAASDEFRARLQ